MIELTSEQIEANKNQALLMEEALAAQQEDFSKIQDLVQEQGELEGQPLKEDEPEEIISAPAPEPEAVATPTEPAFEPDTSSALAPPEPPADLPDPFSFFTQGGES